MTTLFRGDDTEAFNNAGFITINLDTAFDITITKAIFQCGDIQQTFEDPTFPLTIDLTGVETATLSPTNKCYLAVWDENNKKRTCEGSLTFNTQAEVVNG